MNRRFAVLAMLTGALYALEGPLTSMAAPARPVTGTFGRIKDWRIFDFFEPDLGGKKGTNQLKMLLHGAVAHPQKDDTILVDEMWLGSFDRDGRTNLVATAPQSLVDPGNRVVSSTGPLEIQTAQGQLFIKGEGFYCRLTNIVLILSNKVQTLLHREATGTNGTSSTALDRLARTSDPRGTNASKAPLRITSDRFLFDQVSNLVVYTGNVLAQDDLMVLTCRQLTIHVSTNGGVEQILAEHDVMVMGFTNQNRAMGDRAVYRLTGPEEEMVALFGSPARWEDGVRQGQGAHFIFEPKANRLTAPASSLVRTPSAGLLDSTSALAAGKATPSGAAGTNVDYLEIRADWMQARLPSTNQPGRSLVASNGVVVTRPSDQSQVTSDRAFYSDQTGILVLDGNALYQSPQRQIQGETFHLDQSNRTFMVQREARLRVPVSVLGSQGLVQGLSPSARTNAAGAPAPWVEVLSEEAVYRTNQIRFERHVQLILQQGSEILGRAFTDSLELAISSNKVDRADARGQVRMEQPADRSATNRAAVEKRLECQWYTVWLGAGGQVSQMIARTNVLLRQLEYPLKSGEPVKTDLRAETVTAWFAQDTNAVDRIVAERDVVIDQITGSARGQQAVYTRHDDTLVLSGDVILESPRGLLSAPAAVLRHFGLWPGKLHQLDIPLDKLKPPSRTP